MMTPPIIDTIIGTFVMALFVNISGDGIFTWRFWAVFSVITLLLIIKTAIDLRYARKLDQDLRQLGE